jgi:hypothetical protein
MGGVLKQASLVTDSIRTTTYEIRLIESPGEGSGYAVCKLSGSLAANKVGESWWRQDQCGAEKKVCRHLEAEDNQGEG